MMAVVDQYTKNAIFIPTPTICSADKIVQLFLRHVVKHFRVSEDIVSNRDTSVTKWLWTTLFGLLGTELKSSIANHPQTNGQTRPSMHYWRSSFDAMFSLYRKIG